MPRLNDLGHGRKDMVMLDPADIIIQKNFNYREIQSEAAQKHIDWLAQSIRENGVQEPIDVKFEGGKVFLVNGECRLLACRKLRKSGLEIFIPAVAVKGDEAEVLAKSMIANGALPPTQLEFGQAAARLLAYGWTEDRVAAYTPPHIAQDGAKAKRYVREAIELHQSPIAVKKAVQEGIDGVQVSPALALHATRTNPLHAEEEIATQARKAKEKGQKVAKRPKGEGKAGKAKKQAISRQEQLERLGDRMADEGTASSHSIAFGAAAKAWNHLRGR